MVRTMETNKCERKSTQWTNEEISFIKKHNNCSAKTLVELFNRRFNKRSYSSIIHKKNRLMNIPQKKGTKHQWTNEEIEMLKLLSEEGKTAKECAFQINNAFGLNLTTSSISKARNINKIKCSNDGKFKKGKHANVEGELKKGSENSKYKEIGTISWKQYGFKGNHEYIIKISDLKEQKLSRYIWEQHNGEIPKGKNILYKDGNKKNCDINNLMLISNEENALLSFCCVPREFGEMALKYVKIKSNIRKELKRIKDE